MISRNLPPRDVRNRDTDGDMAEAFSLAYLAKYNNVGDFTRSRTSFLRAWGMQTLMVTPRVVDGHPAYTLAVWNDGVNLRATIAIEGATALSQLVTLATGVTSTGLGEIFGRVYGAFFTHAQAIKAILLADPWLAPVLANPNHSLCFAGFSMGAAIAEILGAQFKILDLRRTIKVCKFASPRVGDATWVRATNLTQSGTNWYCLVDPIDAVPGYTTHSVPGWNAAWTSPVTSYAENINQWRGDLNGDRFDNIRLGRTVGFAFAMSALRRTMDEANPWTSHDYDRYRMMISGVASNSGNYNALAPYRFNFLEFPDDNSWGVRLSRRDRDPVFCKFLADPPPADTVVPGGPEEPRLVAAMAVPQVVQPPPMVQNLPAQVVVPRPRGTWQPRRVRDL